MTERKLETNIENLKAQINLLNEQLENIGKILDLQENIMNTLHENRKTLIQEAFTKSTNTNLEELMTKVFPSGKIPEILKRAI